MGLFDQFLQHMIRLKMTLNSAICFMVLLGAIHAGVGLRCLSCTATIEPWLCNVAKTCEIHENACAIRKYRDEGGELRYDTFCSTDALCSNERDNRTVCDNCCHGDICNSGGCGSSGYPANRGPICFSCNQVMDLANCADLAFCGESDLCAVYEERVFDRIFYSSKCIATNKCRTDTIIFGKRQSSQTLCASSCCKTDFCNDNCNGVAMMAANANRNLDINREYLLMYPFMSYSDNIYVLISSTSPGHLDIEVPHISMKKTISLNTGTNYIKFNNTLKINYGGRVEHKGIYLKSSVPVTVFVITDWISDTHNVSTRVERSSGFMVLPVEKLGRQYKAIRGDSSGDYNLITIASLYDNTEINVQLQTTSSYITINGRRYHSGGTYTVTLQRLECICLINSYTTGTTIKSDKPIAVIGGSYLSYYTANPEIEFLPPVSKLGTTFIIPPFPDTQVYYIRLLLASDGDDAVVDVTNAKGTHQYRIKYTDVSTDITVESGPSFITSTRPIYVTVLTYHNSSISSVLVSIPSISNYRNNYTIPSPNSITPHNFDQYAIIVTPSSKLSGLMINNIQVHSTAANPTLLVNSTIYTFLTIPTDDPRNVITHADSSVKFGAFIFGKSQWRQRYGYSRYAFPAGFQ